MRDYRSVAWISLVLAAAPLLGELMVSAFSPTQQYCSLCRRPSAWSRTTLQQQQQQHLLHRHHDTPTTTTACFATTTEDDTEAPSTTKQQQPQTPSSLSNNSDHHPRIHRRLLGSQEHLMLPRQYAPGGVTFPPMNHVLAVVLSSTPSLSAFQQAIDESLDTHPLLRCFVEGTGEPERRIDLLQMVREGEPSPLTFCISNDTNVTSNDVLNVIRVVQKEGDSLEASWKRSFQSYIDSDSWCNDLGQGPLWKLELHRTDEDDKKKINQPCALVFVSNHAISDQGAVNVLLDQLLSKVASIESSNKKKEQPPPVRQGMPLAMEDSVLGIGQRYSDIQTKGFSIKTVRYVLNKALEGFKNPVLLPDNIKKEEEEKSSSGGRDWKDALTIIMGKAPGGGSSSDEERRSTTFQYRTLPQNSTRALLDACRANGVSITHALAAAATLTSSDFVDGGVPKEGKKSRNYKVLQSMDMRRFGAKLDKCETMACMAGSMDLMLGPLLDRSGAALRSEPNEERLKEFWELAKEGKAQTEAFIQSDGPQEATRVFDFGMTISDMNNLVEQSSKSKSTLGRAYSVGITNVGVFERQAAVPREGQKERGLLKSKHGPYEIKDMIMATSHARTGCLYPISCITLGGELKCTFNPAMPIVSEETNARFSDAFIELLETVARQSSTESSPNRMAMLSQNALPTAAAIVGTGVVASHWTAYGQFFESVMEMKNAVADPHDFWAALNFWLFFAGTHPLLPPVFWISEVLHGSPGPLIASLIPVSFLVGNIVVIGAYALSSQFRNAANIAALAAYLTYIGAGLDGQLGLGDYNLALDDSYKGQVVKGCPAYDEVRQPSMDNFDIEKYQGKWYEQKFHDWTQYKQVYDTTLDIKITDGGKAWVDDFAVKGPSPKIAPLSWDKSPVAEGAHYFLFGRVDERDPPGVLRESGFGVEFPNYIVDVQKDPETGEYKEAIQFQCLERGGVRVFEGINFLSRNPDMTEDELNAMHARAEKAGMYPYGASPEQMHTVARRPEDAPPLQNAWQDMWRAIGFDKLLELLAESIEDGGR